MKTLYDALRDSHDRQRHLCLRLTRTGARHPDRRQAILDELKVELAAHAAAEERYLYAPILMDDLGLDASRHALAEHHKIDEAVETLEQLAPDGEAWGQHAKGLAHAVRHHLKEEETRFFQVSGRILLAKAYEKDYARLQRKLAA
ncbi:MAG: hemerythrin domain-containing protein [Burkholderiaceae bacterium]|nr:hemerythrin domain-containing protein [Rhodoferax sp.]MCP5283576.1 hemerythrin domain-containing protein [Burkholderiaceae bacterium]